jgi:hypothetical protein
MKSSKTIKVKKKIKVKGQGKVGAGRGVRTSKGGQQKEGEHTP